MANNTDRDNDSTPDVLERIEQLIVSITQKLPEQRGREDQLATTRLSAASKLEHLSGTTQAPPSASKELPQPPEVTKPQEFGHSANTLLTQILQTLQSMQRIIAQGKPSGSGQVAGMAGTSQPMPPSTTPQQPQQTNQPQENWLERIIGRLTAGRTAPAMSQDAAWKQFDQARGGMANADAELKEAQARQARALREWRAAQSEGVPATKQHSALHKSQERLDQARDRLRASQATVQSAHGNFLQVRHQASPAAIPQGSGPAAAAVSMLTAAAMNVPAGSPAQPAAAALGGSGTPPPLPAAMPGSPNPRPGGNPGDLMAGLSRMMSSERMGNVLAGAGIAAGGPLGGFAKAVGESVEKLRRWNDQLVDSHFRFSEFSGAMAQVQAESEARNARLSQERGDRRAPAARRLTEERDRFERNMAPIEDAISGIWSDAETFFTALANTVIESLTGRNDPQQTTGINMAQFIASSSQSHDQEMFGRPSRFPPPPGGRAPTGGGFRMPNQP
jgi:hypothetical protein